MVTVRFEFTEPVVRQAIFSFWRHSIGWSFPLVLLLLTLYLVM